MGSIARHKTFVSYHHERDQEYKNLITESLWGDIVDRSVGNGDISDSLPTEEIWERVRDEFLADVTVVIVLIGRDTHTRKFVDWEIGSALNKSKKNSRCGVLGIILPDHPSYEQRTADPSLLPPRLVPNINGNDPYVRLYHWPQGDRLSKIRRWVHTAFERREGQAPVNSSKRFQNNRPSTTEETGMTLEDLAKVAAAAGLAIGVGWLVRQSMLKYSQDGYASQTHTPYLLPPVPPMRDRVPAPRQWWFLE